MAAGGRLFPPQWQPLDDNGDPIAGAEAHFSKTGTSTAKDTYDSKAIDSANANPVLADANGRFPDIWGDTDEGYRCVLKSSGGGTTYWTQDNVFAEAAAIDELTRRKLIATSPMDHGAAGDGSTDDATALAAAITAASKVLDLEGKTYRCDSALSLKDGLTIRNGKIDFSNASIASGIDGSGAEVEGTSSAVTTATTDTQVITPASTSGYAAGDLLRIRSADTLESGHQYAELFRVEQISGADIHVNGLILGTYATTPFIEEIDPIQDVVLEDLTIVAPSSGFAIDLELCLQVRVRNVRIESTAAAEGIRVLSCYDVVFEGCTVVPKSTSASGGFTIGDACRDVVVRNCHLERTIVAFDIGKDHGTYDGLTRDILIDGNHIVWESSIGIRCEIGTWNATISDNHISMDTAASTGISVSGRDYIISGNRIRNAATTGISLVPKINGTYASVIDNTIDSLDTAISVNDTTFTLTALTIANNQIEGGSTAYIAIFGTALDSLVISNNYCVNGTGSGADFNITGADGIGVCVIRGNLIEVGGTHGIFVDDVADTDLVVEGNSIQNLSDTEIGIEVDTPRLCRILNNSLEGACDKGIFIDAGGVAAADAILIQGNHISSSDIDTAGILVEGGHNVSIANNVINEEGGDGGIGIHYDWNAAADHVNLSITGNNIRVGADGIKVTAATGTIKGVVIAANVVWTDSSSASEYVCSVIGTGVDIDVIAVTGNVFYRDNDSGDNAQFDRVNQITFAGNAVFNGINGADIGTATEAIHDGNVFSGQSTAAIGGTWDTTGDSA